MIQDWKIEQGQSRDGTDLTTTGVLFRFGEANPLTGRPYAASAFEDLPYFVGVLVRDQLGLSEREWDCLVEGVAVADVVAGRQFRVPFMLGVVGRSTLLAERAGSPPGELCGDCWGSGVAVDTDGTMTSVRGALFVCVCMGAWL